MDILDTGIAGLQQVQLTPHSDNRGSFTRLFCVDELKAVIADRSIVQINRSVTATVGALRGMHFQKPPFAEMKLITCLRGRVFDVAVDLRKNSPTFLQWFGCELSPENGLVMVIPEGFAHGFQVLAQDSELIYFHTQVYTPEAESAIAYNDPEINIQWPLAVTEISDRDQSHPFIDADFQGLS